MRVVDRSRMAAFQVCPRLRYWGYEFGGTGLQRVGPQRDLLLGNEVHRAIAALLMGEPLPPMDEALDIESRCLVEGMVAAWTLVRKPRLLEHHDIVAVEAPMRWTLGGDLRVNLRADLLLRQRVEPKGLVYVEWKTVSEANDRWRASWDHSTQVLSNVLGIEEVMQERVVEVRIEGLIKGRYAADTLRSSPFHGQRIRQSPFCYAFETRDGQLVPTWVSGSQRVRVWDAVTDPSRWARDLPQELLLKQFCPVVLLRPPQKQLDRWRREAYEQELSIAQGQTSWRMHDDACLRLSPCPFLDACFDSQVEADPIGSGLYERRVPHHDES